MNSGSQERSCQRLAVIGTKVPIRLGQALEVKNLITQEVSKCYRKNTQRSLMKKENCPLS